MLINDPVADMLTRIRNALVAKHETTTLPASNMKKAIAQILVDEGYIKGFEVIEAHYLFDMPYEKISTILHKQSIVHSLVEFMDGSIKALIGTSDMHSPISYALRYPSHNNLESSYLDLIGLSLDFKELSFDRYPCLSYAYMAAKKGGVYLAVLNASNEAAVRLFLNDKIEFLDIERIIYSYISDSKYERLEYNLENILTVSKNIMNEVDKKYGGTK